MITLFLALGFCLALTFFLNRDASGQGLFNPRISFGDIVGLMFTTAFFGLWVGVFSRPMLAAVVSSALIVALWGVNKVKVRVLHEPLVFSDIAMLYALIKWPHLYFPFLPKWGLYGGLALFAVAFLGARKLEVALSNYPRLISIFLFIFGVFFFFSLVLFGWGKLQGTAKHLLAKRPLAFNAQQDGKTYTLFGAALLHFVWFFHGRNATLGIPENAQEPPASLAWPAKLVEELPASKPNIVLIQAESFFDLREVVPAELLPTNFFAEFDTLCAEGVSGHFLGNAFGAYTQRAEFSVLSGLKKENLGCDAFDPYLTTALRPVWSLARYLKTKGYRTVCVHPYYPEFFQRHKAMFNMGFDVFKALPAFKDAQTYGPYISDAAFGEALLKEVQAQQDNNTPVFCFGISMEAHGPWLANRFEQQGKKTGQNVQGENAAEEMPKPGLPMYARHLEHTSAMLGAIRANLLKPQSRPAVLGVYGDHPGSLPEITACFASKDNRTHTPYCVWANNAGQNSGTKRDIRPEDLGGVMLEVMKQV